MRTKMVALTLISLIALTAIIYYSVNALSGLHTPLQSPSTAPTPKPTPSKPTVSFTNLNDRTSYPTEITIISPQNNTYQASNLTLKLNVTSSFWVISSVYCKADWLGDYHRSYGLEDNQGILSNAFTLTANFTGIPDGNHTIEVVENLHDGSHAYAAVSFSINDVVGS